jgi:hypothetical protein
MSLEQRARIEVMQEIAREISSMRDRATVPFRFGFCYDRKTALFDAAKFVYDKAFTELHAADEPAIDDKEKL